MSLTVVVGLFSLCHASLISSFFRPFCSFVLLHRFIFGTWSRQSFPVFLCRCTNGITKPTEECPGSFEAPAVLSVEAVA